MCTPIITFNVCTVDGAIIVAWDGHPNKGDHPDYRGLFFGLQKPSWAARYRNKKHICRHSWPNLHDSVFAP